MSGLARWLRFNVVGAAGMCVQLSVLALLNRALPGHYLLASAVAVETAVLHNFVWHVRYTWRDREARSPVWLQWMRFQAANGAVSLVGNVLLMRVLVQRMRMPVVVANVVAIGCCSVINFWLGDGWAFAAHHRRQPMVSAACRRDGEVG